MAYPTTVLTISGGLALLALTAACSSSPNRTASQSPPRDRVIASDRAVYTEDDRLAATDSTGRPVPSNRVGSGDNRIPSDRVVPCADDRGDMTASADCVPPERRATPSASDRTKAACTSRTDAQGHIVYDDPACVNRYGTQTAMGSSYENVRWTQESAFYDRHMDKAVKHAREAEIAGSQGRGAEMMRHAQLSLDRAVEARRAGNVAALNEGILSLRAALHDGENTQWPDSASHIRDARIQLSQAAGMKVKDTRTTAAVWPAGASSASAARTTAKPASRIVKGELIDDSAATRIDGRSRYVVRDFEGNDIPLLIAPEMSRNLHAGDMVEAQLDADGRVVGINKYQ